MLLIDFFYVYQKSMYKLLGFVIELLLRNLGSKHKLFILFGSNLRLKDGNTDVKVDKIKTWSVNIHNILTVLTW